MSRIPFTVYDFFAYLSSGSVIVAVIDYLYGYQWLQRDKQSVVVGLFLVFLAYIVGHLVAHFSSLVMEQAFVSKLLKRPTRTLLGEAPRRGIAWLFPGYYRRLPATTCERVREVARRRHFTGEGEALFLHALAIVKKDEKAMRRLEEFRNLYGFARNMTFSFLVAAVLLAIGTRWGGEPPSYWWAMGAAGLALSMLYRYLKFFRQFSYELFVTYSESLDLSRSEDAR